MYYTTLFLRDFEGSLLLKSAIAIAMGLVGSGLLFYSLNESVDQLPANLQRRVRPLVFVGPAIVVILFYKVGPALQTVYLSFFDDSSKTFVGLANYSFIAKNPVMEAIRNNLFWLVGVTFFSVAFGLLIAALADKVRFEAVFKSVIFLPMAISFVGASIIWRFMYAFAPAGRPQIGALNALKIASGGEPVGWLIERSINNAALIVILIWLQTGFAMVLISAAIKNVPKDLLDAAKVDGASELVLFFRVVVPSIKPTLATVGTTILILTLKVFDIVWVMTNGNFGTEVIASRMMKEIFTFRNFGRGSAIAVVLLLATIPFMIYNVRRMSWEEKWR